MSLIVKSVTQPQIIMSLIVKPAPQPQIILSLRVSDCEDSGMKSTQYEWKLSTARKLLNVLEERKMATPESFCINGKIWPGISKEISKIET